MGNIVLRNRILENMSDPDNSEDVARVGPNDFELLHDGVFNDIQLGEEEDDPAENEFASILRHLIRSGEIMVLNYESFLQHPLPVIKKKPNLDKLKQNDFYQYTKSACGLRDDTLPAGKMERPFSLMRMVTDRQHSLGKRKNPFIRSELCKLSNHFRPNTFTAAVYTYDSKVFCGQYTSDGRRYVTASQDTLIRVYDSSNDRYRLLNTLETKQVSWSILDVDFSPDNNHFVYSTWANSLFVSRLDHGISDTIQGLNLKPTNQKLGVFTVRYSRCGKFILCGASDGSLYVYDLGANRRTLMVPVARVNTDVNSVGFIDDSSNTFFSGSDDGVIKLWDRRCLNESSPEAIGRMIGHYDGVTYIDSRNDGRYIISNSKDQSIKLWDMRKMAPSIVRRYDKSHLNWDYRWDEVPKRFYNNTKPMNGDTSIMTYRGHKVQKSLIRAKFSPAETTGQRYIYTGCGTGRLILYDVLTGAMVEAIEGHKDIVRDVAWHPRRNEILTCSWDCTVHRHTYCNPAEKQEQENALRERLLSHRLELSDSEEEAEVPQRQPVRRSRRLAERYGH